VYYTVADNEEDVNGNNVPDSQEKRKLYVNYQYVDPTYSIMSQTKYDVVFNENYTVTGKSIDSYYFEPEVISGVKQCAPETVFFKYIAKPECDHNNN
jgi:hypothetical protein